MFELSCLSLSSLSLTFEHPVEDSMLTFTFDLSDIDQISCTIYNGSSNSEPICKESLASKLLQK